METKFILPAAIAVAFHVILFFGHNGSPQAAPSAVTSIPVIALQPPVISDPEEPPVEPITDNEEKARKGSTDLRPELDEPPMRPDPSRPETDVPPINPHVKIDTKTIPSDIPGDPYGAEDGDLLRPGGVDISKLDNVPRARVQIGPVYPAEARMRGLDGEVLVAFTVDEEGRVINPRVVRSTDAIFEEAARRAVAKWRFEPGRRQGRVVRFSMAVPMLFRVASE